jgi:hypothetical protein
MQAVGSRETTLGRKGCVLGCVLGCLVCVRVIDHQQPMPALLSLGAQMMLGDLPRTWLSELNAWGSRVTSTVAAAVTNPTPRSSPARPVRAGVPGGVCSAYSSMRGGRAPADAMTSLQLPTPAGEGGRTTAAHSSWRYAQGGRYVYVRHLLWCAGSVGGTASVSIGGTFSLSDLVFANGDIPRDAVVTSRTSFASSMGSWPPPTAPAAPADPQAPVPLHRKW